MPGLNPEAHPRLTTLRCARRALLDEVGVRRTASAFEHHPQPGPVLPAKLEHRHVVLVPRLPELLERRRALARGLRAHARAELRHEALDDLTEALFLGGEVEIERALR